jgi:hypothetical protein
MVGSFGGLWLRLGTKVVDRVYESDQEEEHRQKAHERENGEAKFAAGQCWILTMYMRPPPWGWPC